MTWMCLRLFLTLYHGKSPLKTPFGTFVYFFQASKFHRFHSAGSVFLHRFMTQAMRSWQSLGRSTHLRAL